MTIRVDRSGGDNGYSGPPGAGEDGVDGGWVGDGIGEAGWVIDVTENV